MVGFLSFATLAHTHNVPFGAVAHEAYNIYGIPRMTHKHSFEEVSTSY